MEIYELYGFLMNLLKRFSEQRQLKKTRKKKCISNEFNKNNKPKKNPKAEEYKD